MEGYDDRTYGRAFVDVYDDWYAEVSDVEATVEAVTRAARQSNGRVLELGVGTGRLAIPLAAAGVEVHGIDTSAEMLTVLAAKPGGDRVAVTCGDMVDDLPDGKFGAVVVAYNTLFNLRSEARQRSCFGAVAARLAPDGTFFVEAFVPVAEAGAEVAVRSMSAAQVVLSVSRHDTARQVAEGQFVELRDGAPVRLRPWAIRWSTLAELDAMAAAAGLRLAARHADFAGTPFDDDSASHVSRYCQRVRTGGDDDAVSWGAL
jgi:SAM-dependent methyltransferase